MAVAVWWVTWHLACNQWSKYIATYTNAITTQPIAHVAATSTKSSHMHSTSLVSHRNEPQYVTWSLRWASVAQTQTIGFILRTIMLKNALEQIRDRILRMEETAESLSKAATDHITHSPKIIVLTEKIRIWVTGSIPQWCCCSNGEDQGWHSVSQRHIQTTDEDLLWQIDSLQESHS